jgi:hypothetical protein
VKKDGDAWYKLAAIAFTTHAHNRRSLRIVQWEKEKEKRKICGEGFDCVGDWSEDSAFPSYWFNIRRIM